MNTPFWLLLVLVTLILTARWYRARDRQRHTRRYSAARFPQGTTGKLVGRVCADSDLLTSPLTGRPCVAWTLEAQQDCHAAGGPIGAQWQTVYENSDKCDFTIEDKSGRISVRMEVVDLLLHTTNSASGTILATLEGQQRDWFLHRIHPDLTQRPFNLRLVERLLAEGERVSVVGARETKGVGGIIHQEGDVLKVNSLPGHARG